jgi:hypothetical protein
VSSGQDKRTNSAGERARRGSRGGRDDSRSSLSTRVMGEGWPQDRAAQIGLLIVLLVLAVVAVMGTDFVFSTFGGSHAAGPTAPAASATTLGAASPAQPGVVVQFEAGSRLRY